MTECVKMVLDHPQFENLVGATVFVITIVVLGGGMIWLGIEMVRNS